MDDWMAGGMHGGLCRFWRPREKRRSGCCSVACQSFGHPSTPASWVDPGGCVRFDPMLLFFKENYGIPRSYASWILGMLKCCTCSHRVHFVMRSSNIIIGSTRDEIVQGESCLQRDTFSVFRQVGKKTLRPDFPSNKLSPVLYWPTG